MKVQQGYWKSLAARCHAMSPVTRPPSALAQEFDKTCTGLPKAKGGLLSPTRCSQDFALKNEKALFSKQHFLH